MRVLWNAEQDEWCRGVLRHHWPDAEQYADVRDVGRLESAGQRGPDADAPEPDRRTPAVDLLCGGFPCQDLSVAGKRAGLAGARSGLFHEFARIADALRPPWLLLENVPGLLSSNDGRDFGVLLGTLAELGYGVAWRVLDSRYFGVPQRRRRVFIVARLGDDHASALRALCESCPGSPTASACTWQGAPTRARGRVARSLNAGSRYDGDTEDFVTTGFHMIQDPISTEERTPALGEGSRGMGVNVQPVAFATTDQDRPKADGLTPPLRLNSNGQGTGSGPSVYASIPAQGVRRLTPRECERLQGFPDDFTLVPGLKCPDSRRYAAMGNAVTTNVAEWIGRRIHAIHSSEPASAGEPRPLVGEEMCSPVFSHPASSPASRSLP